MISSSIVSYLQCSCLCLCWCMVYGKARTHSNSDSQHSQTNASVNGDTNSLQKKQKAMIFHYSILLTGMVNNGVRAPSHCNTK